LVPVAHDVDVVFQAERCALSGLFDFSTRQLAKSRSWSRLTHSP
jgi:hypothetical protein